MRRVNEHEVLGVLNLIEQHIPLDGPLDLVSRINNQGRPCIRCQGVSRGKSWFCDIYGKHFFYVNFPPYAPTTVDSVRGLILLLKTHI